MSARGGGRGDSRGSRRSRRPGQPPLFNAGEPIEYGLCREIFNALRGLDDVPDPLIVEMTMSEIVGQWWTMPSIGNEDPDELFGGALVRYAKEQHSPLGLLVLSTLTAISPSPDVRDAAAAAAHSLKVRGVRHPPAAARIGQVTSIRCWVQEDVYGDQADVVIEFSYGEQRRGLCVLVDHNLGGIAKDAFAVDDVDTLVTALHNEAARDEMLAAFREVEPALGRALLESAFAASDDVRGAPVSADFAKLRALLLARVRGMPESAQAAAGREPPTPEQRAALVADFLSSPEAADLDSDTAGHLATLFVEFGCAQDPARPTRISPLKLEHFLHRWLPRHAVLDEAERAALPATVRALVAWARSRVKLPRQAVRELDAATEDIIGAFAGEYDDPVNFAGGDQRGNFAGGDQRGNFARPARQSDAQLDRRA